MEIRITKDNNGNITKTIFRAGEIWEYDEKGNITIYNYKYNKKEKLTRFFRESFLRVR